LWGGIEAIQKHSVEEPVVLSRITTPEDYADNLYYLDFAKPQDLVDAANIPLLRDRHLFADVSMGRHRSEGLVSDGVIADMRRLAPHLRRAAAVSGMLSLAEEAVDTFEAAIESTPAAVILVDETLSVVHANSAASEMLDENDPLTLLARRVAIRQPLVPNALEDAVRAAVEAPYAMGRKGISIPARRSDESPVALHVFPLLHKRGGKRPGRAIAALFVTERGAPQSRADFLGAMFELTPAEARVLDLTSTGLSNPKIAQELGVATSTVKTHMLRIFAKTGRHNRAELVRLASDLRPRT
jgi:DNA-binding CsgD family transcriptional regulator